MQVARVGVERGGLLADRLDDPGMAMADMRHIVVTVQIVAPIGVPDAGALPRTRCTGSS